MAGYVSRKFRVSVGASAVIPTSMHRELRHSQTLPSKPTSAHHNPERPAVATTNSSKKHSSSTLRPLGLWPHATKLDRHHSKTTPRSNSGEAPTRRPAEFDPGRSRRPSAESGSGWSKLGRSWPNRVESWAAGQLRFQSLLEAESNYSLERPSEVSLMCPGALVDLMRGSSRAGPPHVTSLSGLYSGGPSQP